MSQRSGLPAGVVNVVTNAPSDAAAVVEALIAHPAVRRINFTGSTAVGRIIGELAGRHLKPALLELGGKAPLVILDDADIDAAVNAAVFGAYMNQGQICMSTERIIVDESIADECRKAIRARRNCRPAIRADRSSRDLSIRAAERNAEMVKTTKGATLRAGGKREGTVVQATVLDNVTPTCAFMLRSPGPVTHHPRKWRGGHPHVTTRTTAFLGGSAATSNVPWVAAQLERASATSTAQWLTTKPRCPSGRQGSGYGRFGGKAAIAEFTDLRWITIEDPNQPYPF